jgi:DNA-binding winged helix-turn-helix (wHTH) protein
MSAPTAPLPSPGQPAGASKPIFPPSRYACFAAFHLDFKKEELFRDGVRVKLQGKVYQALFALLQKPGEIVTREELCAHLWPSDTHVNYDANVNTTVNKLRQVLGDSSDRPAFVDTITRKGYSFVAKVEYLDQPRTPLMQEPRDSAFVANAAQNRASESAYAVADAAHRFAGVSARQEVAPFAGPSFLGGAQRDGSGKLAFTGAQQPGAGKSAFVPGATAPGPVGPGAALTALGYANAQQEAAGDKLSFIRAALHSKWFTAGVVSLVIASMLFGAALVLYAHH